jgi:hypothetical protein
VSGQVARQFLSRIRSDHRGNIPRSAIPEDDVVEVEPEEDVGVEQRSERCH